MEQIERNLAPLETRGQDNEHLAEPVAGGSNDANNSLLNDLLAFAELIAKKVEASQEKICQTLERMELHMSGQTGNSRNERNFGEEAISRPVKQDELGGQSSGGSHDTNGSLRPQVQNPLPPPVEDRYQPPRRREEGGGFIRAPTTNGRHFGNGRPGAPMAPQQFFGAMNPNNHPANYEEGAHAGIGPGGNPPLFNRGNPSPAHFPPQVDVEIVREVVQELYGPGLRQIGRPEFHKPYPDAIERENPYP